MDRGDSQNKNIKLCEKCKGRNWLIECTCGKCGQVIPSKDKQYRTHKFVLGHATKLRDNYQGGRLLRNNYWYIYKRHYFSSYESGYVLEHVFVYQEFHKCCILPWV